MRTLMIDWDETLVRPMPPGGPLLDGQVEVETDLSEDDLQDLVDEASAAGYDVDACMARLDALRRPLVTVREVRRGGP